MADEAQRKKIKEHVSTWDKLKTSLTPGLDISEREKRLNDIADSNIREKEREAQLEAIRKKRMQTPGTGGQ